MQARPIEVVTALGGVLDVPSAEMKGQRRRRSTDGRPEDRPDYPAREERPTNMADGLTGLLDRPGDGPNLGRSIRPPRRRKLRPRRVARQVGGGADVVWRRAAGALSDRPGFPRRSADRGQSCRTVPTQAGRRIPGGLGNKPKPVDDRTRSCLTDGRNMIYRLAIKDQPKPPSGRARSESKSPKAIVSPLAVVGNVVYGVDDSRYVAIYSNSPSSRLANRSLLGGKADLGPPSGRPARFPRHRRRATALPRRRRKDRLEG